MCHSVVRWLQHGSDADPPSSCSSSMLTTHCFFLCSSSTISAPSNPSFLLYRDLRLQGLGDLSDELSKMWNVLPSTGVSGPGIWIAENVGSGKPESSKWQSSSTSMAWACIVESVGIVFLRSLPPSLSLWEDRTSSSQTHSSESLPHFIWTSKRCCWSATGSLIPLFMASLREAWWWWRNLLLRPRNRQPPPPPLACLVGLLETPTSTFESSESSELPSYGSKNYRAHVHLLINLRSSKMLWRQKNECFSCFYSPKSNSQGVLQVCVVMAMSACKSHFLAHCSHIPGQRETQGHYKQKTGIHLQTQKRRRMCTQVALLYVCTGNDEDISKLDVVHFKVI